MIARFRQQPLAVLVLCCVAFLPAISAAATADTASKTRLVVHIHTANEWPAVMGIMDAMTARADGHDAVIFLDVLGVRNASKSAAQTTDSITGMTPKDALKMAMKKGVKVCVCPGCMARYGLPESDMIKGVLFDDDAVTRLQLEPGTHTITY